MYLSRVQLDTNNRQKIRHLTHLGAYHDWVERSFPEEFARNERTRKLWRIDYLNGKEYLLIVSQEKPDIAALCRYGVEGSAATKEYEPFLNHLRNGMKCRFRIVLNPVMADSTGIHQGERGRIKPHVTVKQQMKYLKDRAETHGFLLYDEEYIVKERNFAIWRKGKERIRLSRVAYEGILCIENVDVFRRLLTEGMGKKKAYGFGMMTVIPLEV